MVEHQTSGTFVLVVGRVMRYLVCCTGTADLYLAVLNAMFNLFLGPPPPGGPGGGSGRGVGGNPIKPGTGVPDSSPFTMGAFSMGVN